MGYKVSYEQADKIFKDLSETYEIWAPKRLKGKGRYSQTDLIRYEKITSAEEIEYKEKSDFPAKEVLSPITQSLFYLSKARLLIRSC